MLRMCEITLILGVRGAAANRHCKSLNYQPVVDCLWELKIVCSVFQKLSSIYPIRIKDKDDGRFKWRLNLPNHHLPRIKDRAK